ncbi:MAG: metal-dependent phosphohydrolase [Gammaproteobacteria bacterium]|nr:metal-dependent phosphohydrolase [Gammaproteobacteria bacterium]MCP5201676.1 metal-dependent phosphohydrolase [Gammaproteobacteria bacterium]
MLDVTEVLTGIVTERATAHYGELFSGTAPEHRDLACRAAHSALTAISGSDALYHNIEHTAHVTLVGLEILYGKQRRDGDLTPALWLNTVIALLCHDIGYVRGLCRADTGASLASGQDGQAMRNVSGSSDAVLMPIHVNRGKRFVEEQFLGEPRADVGFINACIERTRFPVPDDAWYAQTGDFPGLVRAADLIGQLSDPRYLNKLSAIFFEFEEIGFNQLTGYTRPGDLLTGYPSFFANNVAPYIDVASDCLQQTDEGRDILRHLYDNLERARTASTTPLASAANG